MRLSKAAPATLGSQRPGIDLGLKRKKHKDYKERKVKPATNTSPIRDNKVERISFRKLDQQRTKACARMSIAKVRYSFGNEHGTKGK